MRKIFFTLIGVLLLSTAAFGSDRVLFKMVNLQTTGTLNTDAEGVIFTDGKCNLNPYVFLIGGTAELYKSTGYDFIKNGCIRVYTKTGYLHIHLDRPLLATDVIRYTDNGQSEYNDLYVTTTASRTSGNLVSPSSPLTATNLEGAQDLYFWYGSLSESARHIQSLTITTNDPEVVYYDFEGETVTDFSEEKVYSLQNGLKLNSDGKTTHNTIASVSEKGYSKMLNIVGDDENRSLMLTVTDPCTIEIWGRSTNSTARSLYLSEGSYYRSGATAVLSSVTNSLSKGTYTYTKTDDSKTLYISPDGGFYVAAIRVTYPRIRPVAKFSVTPASAVLHVGDPAQVFTYNKDYKDATITRSKTTDSENSWVARGTEVANTSVAFTALEAGIGHTYTIKLTQKADTICRAAVVEVPIRILGANESVSDVAWNSSYVSTTSYVWKNNENVTLIQNSNEATFDNNHSAIGEFAAGTGLRLAAGKTYTLSAPSNKQIARVTFSGYTAQTGTGSIRVNGVASAFNAYDAENPVIKDIVYNDINAQSFTFEAYNRNIIVKIDLVTTDLGYYPVTFGSNWASFCAPKDVQLPDGVFAYIASANDGETITVNKVEGNKVPANEGVLLYSESLASCHVTATTDAPSLDGNILQFTTARTARSESGITYALNGDEGCFQEYTGNYIPANKAYVHMPSGAAPKRLRIVKGGDKVPTGVEAVSDQPSVVSQKLIENGQLVIIRDGVKYNVQGQIIK